MCHQQSQRGAAEQSIWWLPAQPVFNTTWKIITCASFELGLPRERGSEPHSPAVGSCHPAPLASLSENSFQEPRRRPCNFFQTLLPGCGDPTSPVCSCQHLCHSSTCWPISAPCDDMAELLKLTHTYKFCENMWLDRDFMSSSFHWAESGLPVLATGKSTWETVFSLWYCH